VVLLGEMEAVIPEDTFTVMLVVAVQLPLPTVTE
jgi:hypothetical protein